MCISIVQKSMCCESFEFSFNILDVHHTLLPQITVALWSVSWNTEPEDQGTIPAMTIIFFSFLIFYLFFLARKDFEFALFEMPSKINKSKSVHQQFLDEFNIVLKVCFQK